MKSKIITAVLALSVIVSTSACEDNNNNNVPTETLTPQQTADMPSTAAPVETAIPSMEPLHIPNSDQSANEHRSTEEIVKTAYPEYSDYSLMTDFSSGVAWVTFGADKLFCYAIIDSIGNIIYVFEASDYTKATVHEFVDGLSYIECEQGLIFVDKLGNEVFSLQNDENTTYEVVGRGGGIIMLYKTVHSFSQDGLYVLAVDTEGNMLTDELPAVLKYTRIVYEQDGSNEIKVNDPYSAQYNKSWTFLKDGIFYYGNPNHFYDDVECCIFNTHTGEFFRVPAIIIRLGWGGHNYFYSMYPYFFLDDNTILSLGGMVYSLDILSSEQSVLNYLQTTPKRIYCWNSQYQLDALWNKCGEGLHYVNQFSSNYHYYSLLFSEVFGGDCPSWDEIIDGYYDYDGNLVVSIPEFPDGVETAFNSYFSGGYAFVYLQGVDKRYYGTMINMAGEIMFEPVLIESIPSYENFYLGYMEVSDGYLNYSGNIVTFESLPSEVQEFFHPSDSTKVKFDHIVASANTKYPASSKAAIVTKPIIITPPKEEQQNEPEIIKDYIALPNFKIEGKWKNVGSYTYGQVQSGAIVSFDGVNCNVFSPRDTYAFYKDGDDYRLDCTSLLADTISFTVKIVDENNIDIFNGANILELTRVG